MVRKILAITLAVSYLLCFYNSPIPGVDLSSVLVIISLIILLFHERKVMINTTYVPFVIYLSVTTIFNILVFEYSQGTFPSSFLVMMRLAKFVLIFSSVFVFRYCSNVDKEILIRCVRIVVYINTAFVLIQQLMFRFGDIVVKNPLSIIAVNEIYSSDKYSMVATTVFRPSGLFLEPAHLSQYFLLFVCYVLFCNKREYYGQKRGLDYCLSALGILLTGSGMGILMLSGLSVLALFLRSEQPIIKRIVYASALLVIVAILSRIEFVRTVFDRVFSSGSEYGGNAMEARIGTGYGIFGDLPFINKVFGCGYGNIPIDLYFNGITYMINTIGIIGVILFVLVIWNVFIKTNKCMRITVLCYVALLIGAQMFSASAIVFYLGIACIFIPNTDPDHSVEYGKE